MVDMRKWTSEELDNHSLDARQFIDFRPSTLPNGSRIIDAYNGSGLTFTLLPDRGLDIWSAHYNGIPLTWLSLGSPFPPDFGLSWLQQFNGGLLTTCGLRHVGGPETDPETGEFRDFHGRFSRLRAREIQITRDSTDAVDLSGTISESRMHGEQLEVSRWYTLYLGEPKIHLVDVITNLGDAPEPLMLLYHFNLGFPLVSQGARLMTAGAGVVARDPEARKGLDRWAEYDAAQPRYAEQVFFHHVKEDADGMSEVILANEDLGLSIRWNASEMPYLTQWKNTRQGMYVNGIEPGNCIPEGQVAARKSGRLQFLEPGESRSFNCQVTVLDGSEALAEALERVRTLEQFGTAVANFDLPEYTASPGNG